MKKLYVIAASLALLAASCEEESALEFSQNYVASNLVIPADGSTKPYVTNGNYLMNFKNSDVQSMAVSGLKLGGQDASFTTGPLATQAASTTIGALFVFSGSGGVADGMPVTDIQGAVTGVINYTQRPVIGITTIPAIDYGPLIFASYKIGDKYLVKTFFKDMYYNGSTTTTYTYKGEDKTYTNESIMYRVVFSQDFATASLVIYDGKFAAEQPDKGVYDYLLLADLPVTWSADGFSIKATNVIPQYEEGGVLEQQARYMFDNIVLTNTEGKLSLMTLDFEVAGMYKGHFEGKCGVTSLWE